MNRLDPAVGGAADPACRTRAIMAAVPFDPRLAPDEPQPLHAARLAQDGEHRPATEALRGGMVSSAGASAVLGALRSIGDVFARAGLRLAPRSLPAGDPGPDPMPAPAAPLPLR